MGYLFIHAGDTIHDTVKRAESLVHVTESNPEHLDIDDPEKRFETYAKMIPPTTAEVDILDKIKENYVSNEKKFLARL
jgi:hypothetical protein